MLSRSQVVRDNRIHSRRPARKDEKRELQGEIPSQENCRRAVNRLLDETADFNEIFKLANEDPEFKFTDDTFSFPDSIHWPDVPIDQYSLAGQEERIEWTRISNRFWTEDYSMWGENNIEPDDSIQGQLGNCWLHVAGISIAEQPDRIRDLFLVDEKNSAGVYAATMYLLGMPITVVIDDYLPLEDTWEGLNPVYGEIGDDKALWGPILEKAFAKYLGQYEAIDAGIGAYGIEVMTGSPFTRFWHDEAMDNEEIYEDLWKALVDSDAKRTMITSASYNGTGSDQDTNAVGLPYTHAFSIMYVVEVVDEEGESHRLVCVRNPWGREKYFGPWSDQDERWTDDLRAQANHFNDKEDNNDGIYFMAYEDYVEYMESTDINMDVSKMFHSGFLFQNDDEPVNRRRVFQNDFDEYNIHTLRLYSKEPQQVALSAYGYNLKQYHGECFDQYVTSSVLMQTEDEEKLGAVWPGSVHKDLFEMDEGFFEVLIMTKFGE